MRHPDNFRNVRRAELLSPDVEPRSGEQADLRLVWGNAPMRVAVSRAQAAALARSLQAFADGDAHGS